MFSAEPSVLCCNSNGLAQNSYWAHLVLSKKVCLNSKACSSTKVCCSASSDPMMVLNSEQVYCYSQKVLS